MSSSASSETSPISDLTISGNTLDYLQLGASESFALNGNVTKFRVSTNFSQRSNSATFAYGSVLK